MPCGKRLMARHHAIGASIHDCLSPITYYKSSHTLLLKKRTKMKKLFIAAATVLALASCGNKTDQNANGSDSIATDEVVTTIEEQTDSITAALEEQLNENDAQKVETTLTTIKQTYEELVSEGKTEEAQKYASKLKEFYDKNAETIKNVASGNTTVTDLVNGIVNLPTSVEQAVSDAKDAANADAAAASDAATKTVNDAKQKVSDAVSTAEKDAKQTVSDTKEAVKKAAKEKVTEETNKAVNNALNKVLGN